MLWEIPGNEISNNDLEKPILVDTLDDVRKYLSEKGILNEGGIFLSDVDKTLRDPYTDARQGKFDRLPVKTMEILFDLQQNDWKLAVVTNQPPSGHAISRITSSNPMSPYTRAGDFFARNEIQIFGPNPGFYRFPMQAVTNTITTLSNKNAQDIGGIKYAPWYKSTPKAVEEVGDWVNTALTDSASKTVVWVGNTKSDVLFAGKLADYLKAHDFSGEFMIFKLPDEFGGTHEI